MKIKTSGSGLTSGDGQVNVTGGNIDITSGDYGIEADMGVYLSDTSLKIDSESAGIYNMASLKTPVQKRGNMI